MTQWMGNLFYRKQPIPVIRSLRYVEMKEWNQWHEIMIEQERKAIEDAKGKKK